MHQRTSRIAAVALLLTVVFLGAQFHSCADLSAAPAASHFCPVCSATTSAMASETILLLVADVSDRLENSSVPPAVSTGIPRAISPRAPPTCRTLV